MAGGTITIAEQSENPPAPGAGKLRLFAKGDEWYSRNSVGTVIPLRTPPVTRSVGDLSLIALTNTAIGENAVTGERGNLVRMVNGTGAASVKGMVVSCSTTVDKQFVAQSNEFDAFAVVAEAGIANGEECWLWVSGSTAQVLWEDGESATRGYVALCAPTDGRALNIAVPSSSPAVGEHFKEIGHPQESKASGTNVLVLCTLHFL